MLKHLWPSQKEFAVAHAKDILEQVQYRAIACTWLPHELVPCAVHTLHTTLFACCMSLS